MRSMKPDARQFFAADHHERRFEDGARSIIEGLYARMAREQQQARTAVKPPRGKKRRSN
jgi:hypothetical protein